MRTAKPGKLLVVGLLGMTLTAPVFADPGPATPPRPGSTSVFSQMFGKKPTGATVTPTDAARPTRPAPRSAADPMAKARDKELANWLRRTAVCLKLMEVADQTGDESLRKKAQELESRARATYERRMAQLGGEAGIDDDLDKIDRGPNSTRSAGVVRGDRQTEGGSE